MRPRILVRDLGNSVLLSRPNYFTVNYLAGQTRSFAGTLRSMRYPSTALRMQAVSGYAVWPSPSQVNTCPLPSMVASFAVDSYGVAGSPLVPTTTMGGAPTALPTGYGSCLAG